MPIRTLWRTLARSSDQLDARSAARSRPASQHGRARRQLDVAALEDRVLFSAGPVGAALEGGLDPDGAAVDSGLVADAVGADTGIAYVVDEADATWTDADRSAAAVGPGEDDDLEIRRELVFVDTATSNYQQLLDDLWSHEDPDREFEVVLISADRDGVEQITAALDGYEDLDAIHILSHGTDNAVQLGNGWLS
ncbi:MAG: DUF4347 domain-containing protein, partial [Bythopirellula sp.]